MSVTAGTTATGNTATGNPSHGATPNNESSEKPTTEPVERA